MINLTGGGLSGGAKKTLLRLTPALRDEPRISQLDVWAPPLALEQMPEFCQKQNVQTWPVHGRLAIHRYLKKQINKLKPDVIYIPNADWLDAGDVPVVVMLRNMEAAARPFANNPLKIGVLNKLRQYMFRRAVRKAKRVVAVSGYVRDFLVTQWQLSPRKIGVVPHGVDPALSPEETQSPSSHILPVNEPFWFTAGSLLGYRGLEDAIRAIGLRKDLPGGLAIAGASVHSDAYQNAMRRLAETLGVSSRLYWLGHLPPEEMGYCYQNAIGFLMTSRAEACPNTVLEAMSYGCPSISTSCAPMPEFFADTAEFYPAGDFETLSREMSRLAAWDSDRRAKTNATMIKRAEEFTWAACAKNTVDELQKALE